MRMRGWMPFLLAAALLSGACQSRPGAGEPGATNRYARWFEILDSAVVTISPFDGTRDTVSTAVPLTKLVCFSTSYSACLSALSCPEAAVGVSGLRFVRDSVVRSRAIEVGYEGNPDYEALLGLRPDLVLTYYVSSSVPAYVTKLSTLGTRVFVLYEHLEEHPLARAEYLRLFGALTHRRAEADSLFAAIEARYLSLAFAVEEARRNRPEGFTRSVLLNIPYEDLWYVPGADSYLSRLIRDAGGEVAGARAGTSFSRPMGMEEAFALSQEADCWLHPGWCRTRADLLSVHPLFADFPVIRRAVYNNTLRMEPEGGNDFWESGAVYADRVLSDLVTILHPEVAAEPLYYYLPLE